MPISRRRSAPAVTPSTPFRAATRTPPFRSTSRCPTERRRRFTSGVRDYGMTFRMTKAQVATLDSFYLTTLSGGVVKYDWTNPRTGTTDTFRFKSPLKYQHRTGDFWRVVIEIEQLP